MTAPVVPVEKPDLVPCNHCGTALLRHRLHIFKGTDGLIVTRLCGTCCPRCWGGTGKAA